MRVRFALALDAVCIVAFVLIGRGNHGIHGGAGWFVTVLWPLSVGWFAVALATRLYTRTTRLRPALAATCVGGVAVDAALRGTFTDRPYLSVFTIIAVSFIGLTTFGWRAAAALLLRRTRHAPST
jgi:hypothetical protein